MPPAENSRKGKQIARKACDLCRERKVQCAFEDGNDVACRKCIQANVPCTFLKDRKPRGPPNRRIANAQERSIRNLSYDPSSASASPVNPGKLPLPNIELTIDHFCTPQIFENIVADFLELVYPVLPIVHRPSFRAALHARQYETDAAFFRLAISVCAVTVASIPRRIDIYGGGVYSGVTEMVDRASSLVMASRVFSDPLWANHPSIETMLSSTLLLMATHYAGRPTQGWTFAGEAIHFFRTLNLFKKEGYASLNVVDTELCKRTFWVLYITQIHDRLSFIVPHTGMSYDPSHTDWEFLLPLEVDDENLGPEMACDSPQSPQQGPTPLISGFVGLIKVFLCVADLLSNGFPGSPQGYTMSSGTLGSSIIPESPSISGETPGSRRPGSSLSLNSMLRMIKRLSLTLNELPDELKLPHNTHLVPPASYQFDIMRANIHITSLYIQSTILETCSSTFQRATAASLANGTDPPERATRVELWKFRESIATELLEVLKFCSPWTLEANGSSMIVKIREIAATLLDRDDGSQIVSEIEERSRSYVKQFVEILADLDYSSRNAI